jgi:hypothetical protein
MRNSLFKIAIVREILYSHSLLMRAILINLPQKIAKFQTNASAPDGCLQANILALSGSTETNIYIDSMGLPSAPTSATRNRGFCA